MDIKLKRLELYREKRPSYKGTDLPTIEDNLNVLDEHQKKSVATYMDDAALIAEFLSSMRDPYFQDDIIPNTMYSDGEYVWDSVIVNWVKTYGVRLPQEFLDHVASYNGDASQFSDVESKFSNEEIRAAEKIFVY